MNWITEDIAIGNYLDAKNVELLKKEKIQSVISLNGQSHDAEALGIDSDNIAKFNLIDGPGNDIGLFRRVIQNLTRLVNCHPPVFVHCHAGQSRSVAIVAGHLMFEHSMEPDEAISLIGQKRNIAVASELRQLLYLLQNH